MKEVVVSLFSSLHTGRSKFSNRYSLVVCIIFVTISSSRCSVVTPSPTHAESTSAPLRSLSVSPPLPSPLTDPPYECSASTGPEGQDFDLFLIATDHVYLDISDSVNCSGIIVRWHICHFLIGFRDATSSLSFCVWRRSNTSEEVTYETVGCNTLTTVPGDGESFRCRTYAPDIPADFLTVEEGDHIGFYVPDSALLPALSVPENDGSHFQMIRNTSGWISVLRLSELRNLSCTPGCGRALLKADIESDFVPSIVVPSSLPTTQTTDQLTTAPETVPPVASGNSLNFTIGLLISVVITVILIVIVVVLLVYVGINHRSKNAPQKSSGVMARHEDEMEYNNMYDFRNAESVIVGNRRTAVRFSSNPAYDYNRSTCMGNPSDSMIYEEDEDTTLSMDDDVTGAASGIGRRQLEHTYESISNYYVQAVNVN